MRVLYQFTDPSGLDFTVYAQRQSIIEAPERNNNQIPYFT